MGFIGRIVTRTTLSFFLPFKFLRSPSKLKILTINLPISLYQFRGLQWSIRNILTLTTGDWIFMQWIIEVVGLIRIKGVNVLHYLFAADVERDVDIDRFAIGILLDGRIVVHLVIT